MSEFHVGRIALSPDERLDIVGPCAAQSRRQVMECAREVASYGIRGFRACVFKPRTEPYTFEGVGSRGYPWLAEASDLGLVVATELRTGRQVRKLAEILFDHNPNASLVVWVGSRNTDHVNVRSIGRAAAEDSRISVGHKNPMHLKHGAHPDWVGLVNHLRSGGMSDDHVFLVHRGFSVNDDTHNPDGMKNLPNHEVAMRVSEKLGLPIIMDLSHPAGVASKVELVAEGARLYDYRGLMIEAATPPRISEAKTDKAQHVTVAEAAAIIQRDIVARRALLQERAA